MLHVFNFYFLMHNHLKMIKETLYANSYKEMDFGDSGVACLIVNDTVVREKLYDTVRATTR